MHERFITALIIYFAVIQLIGNAPTFLTVTLAQQQNCTFCSAHQRTAIATVIMLFFALCDASVVLDLDITEAAFKIAGYISLFLVTLDMLAAKRQRRKRAHSTSGGNTGTSSRDYKDSDKLSVYQLAIMLLAGLSATMSIIVVNSGFARTLEYYNKLLAVMLGTGFILCLTMFAEG